MHIRSRLQPPAPAEPSLIEGPTVPALPALLPLALRRLPPSPLSPPSLSLLPSSPSPSPFPFLPPLSFLFPLLHFI
ncbi:hypothetical protein H9Q72_014574, partial [Fusarium xylarioides]